MDIKNYLMLLAAVIFLAGFAGTAAADEDLVVDNSNVTPQFIAEAITKAGGIVTGIQPGNMGPPVINFNDSYGNCYYATSWNSLSVSAEARPLLADLQPEDRAELYQELLEATDQSSAVFSFWYGVTNTTPSLRIRDNYRYDGTNSKKHMEIFLRDFMYDSRLYYRSSELFAEYFGPMK